MADRKVIARSTAARNFRKYEKSEHETYLWIHDFLNQLALTGIIWNEKCLWDRKMKKKLWILLVDRLVITPGNLLPTQFNKFALPSYRKTNRLIFLSFFVCYCIRLSGLNELVRCCYHLALIKSKLRMNVSYQNKVYFWCP
jgi:hypothetical protein